MKVSEKLIKLGQGENKSLWDKIRPWSSPQEIDEWKKKRNARASKDLLTLGAVSFTLPFLVESLRSRSQQKESTKRLEKMRQAALADHPYVSIDPNLEDAEEEEKYRTAGVVKQSVEGSEDTSDKTSDKDGSYANVWSLFEAPYKATKKVLGFSDPSRPDVYPALALMTMALAGGAGWKVADARADKVRKERLDEKIQESRNQLDKEQFQSLTAGRNLPKTSAEKEEGDGFGESLWKGVKQTLPLYIALLTYGGWKAGRHLGKDSNPQRKAYEDLKRQLDHKAKRGDRPAQLSFSPEMKNMFEGSRPDAEPRNQSKDRTLSSALLP